MENVFTFASLLLSLFSSISCTWQITWTIKTCVCVRVCMCVSSYKDTSHKWLGPLFQPNSEEMISLKTSSLQLQSEALGMGLNTWILRDSVQPMHTYRYAHMLLFVTNVTESLKGMSIQGTSSALNSHFYLKPGSARAMTTPSWIQCRNVIKCSGSFLPW